MDDDTENEYDGDTDPEDNGGDSPMADEDEEEMSKEDVVIECTELFQRKDFIMEPDIINQLKRYFSADGDPEKVIDLLSANYDAVAQSVNLLAEWLIMTGMKIAEVQSLVEDHLKQLIIKHFEPDKADSIFKDESATTPAWLTEMIQHATWRSLIYKLAEDYPDCLMLTFTIKLISDAGFQGEITSISTASQQLEVFARVMKTSVNNFLVGNEKDMEKNLSEFTKMVCHSEHTMLYSSALLHILSQETKGGSNIKRLYQEITQHALKNGHDATPIMMALNGANGHPKVAQALSAMLAKNSLNPADITVLYKMFSAPDPPPVELLRVPQFLDLLLEALFKPGSKLHHEHKPKYIFLLSYASSVYEQVQGKKANSRKIVNKEELKGTLQAIEKVNSICTEKKGSAELLAELGSLYQCIKMSPVVALGVTEWVRYTVMEKTYFQLSTEHTPLHLALLDEVTACHTLLHQKVLDLLTKLFEAPQDSLDVLVYMEIKKMLIDRMVHLLSKGCVVPVISYVKLCWEKQDTDVSLIRYFVTEVLDIISTPYSPEFLNLFLPLVANEEITGSIRSDGESVVVNQFMSYCKSNHPTEYKSIT
ncbi:Negative elongation factor D [Halotydeus destructor]|nr:Negative elongation factor D [Halotydeus destructor]